MTMLAPAADRTVTATDNSPSPAIEAAKDTLTDLSKFLQDNPVIENFEQDKQITNWIERAKINLASLDDELAPKADPIYAQWKAIREPYTAVVKPLERLFEEAKRRATKFKNAIEAARRAEAERLRLEAEAKERLAREAEIREADAKAAVDVGVCEDVGNAIIEADASFRDFQVANRQAATAEKNVPLRVASIVGGRPVVMRNKRVLMIDDWQAAIKAMGLTEKIVLAIRQSAKDFEDAFGELPTGISATIERSL